MDSWAFLRSGEYYDSLSRLQLNGVRAHYTGALGLSLIREAIIE